MDEVRRDLRRATRLEAGASVSVQKYRAPTQLSRGSDFMEKLAAATSEDSIPTDSGVAELR